MAENHEQLSEKIADIREWLVRIDTKVDFFNDVKHTAERAESKADRALLKTDDLDRAVEIMRTTTKWAIGLTVGSLLTAAGIVVSIVF